MCVMQARGTNQPGNSTGSIAVEAMVSGLLFALHPIHTEVCGA